MSYRKGYRYELLARDHMKAIHNCVCVRSSGSHGVADLICGNGETVYVIQVKGGRKLPYVSWTELEQFARQFKGVPLILYKSTYRSMIECWSEEDLKKLRKYLTNLRRK